MRSFKLPNTAEGLKEARQKNLHELGIVLAQLGDPEYRARFATEKEYLDWRAGAIQERRNVESRLALIKGHLNNLNQERIQHEQQLQRAGLKIDKKDPLSFAHALWSIHERQRKRGIRYPEEEWEIIWKARDHLIEAGYLKPVKKVIVRPPPAVQVHEPEAK